MYDKYGNLIADPYKKISNILYNHLNLPSKITFLSGGKNEYFYDGIGTKLKKKVTDGTTITTTEYMQGFQYTNNSLDFFPHSEGYVKALAAGLGGGTSYDFKYVFTYTDHTSAALSTGLGNIRLKYAQDPSNNNQISILEEDHYYPYGLKHSGYNSFHQIFAMGDDGDGPGTGIVLTPVNPFLGDSYKYKFGGKEYQDEFDANNYDFGARNYDPALARWMNVDPLAELMRRHSPYNYAFNNPVYFIDPDGMMPGGFANTNTITSTGSFESYDFGDGGASSGGGSGEESAQGLLTPVDNSSDNGNASPNLPDAKGEPQVLSTKYIDEAGNTIIDTNDGSEDIITVPNDRLAEFIKNVYWTGENQLNSEGWNIYWKTEILGFENSVVMENILSNTASQSSRQALINYIQTGTISNGFKFALTEVLYQNLNPINHLPTPINTKPVNPWVKFNRQMGPGKFTKQNYGSSKAAGEARTRAYSKWKRENKNFY